MGHHQETEFRPARVAVITVSDTRTEKNDTSGALIVEALNQAGHRVVFKTIVKDEMHVIRGTVSDLLDQKRCSYIILTGGTGLTHRDVTPEAIRPLYTKSIPGFGELFRLLSYDDIGTATMQSRVEAGLCGHAVVFALPGSTNACRLGMEKMILPQLDQRTRPCSFRGVITDVHD